MNAAAPAATFTNPADPADAGPAGNPSPTHALWPARAAGLSGPSAAAPADDIASARARVAGAGLPAVQPLRTLRALRTMAAATGPSGAPAVAALGKPRVAGPTLSPSPAPSTPAGPPRRAPSAGMTVGLLLDRSTGRPLHVELFDCVRRAVGRGQLRPGQRLPSTRALARHLNLARNTVARAFEQLGAEGYLCTRQGSGTFIADDARGLLAEAAPPPRRPRAPAGRSAAPPALSRRGVQIAGAPHFDPGAGRGPLAFRLGTPALDGFPGETWARLMQRRWQTSSAALLRASDPRGHAGLRTAIADYLGTTRGVQCDADHVLIVAGAQQAFALLAQVTLDPGDEVWGEDPGYLPARQAVIAAGGVVRPVPVDEQGLDVAEGVRRAPGARLAIVTPANQFPLSVPLSDPRRQALLDWARGAGAWILEDDYDGDLFRYTGSPRPALHSLDRDGRVAYVGTFSKVISPALRVGYLVVPDPLLDACLAAKVAACQRTPLFEQAVLSDFIEQGHFLRHVRRTRVLYDRRRAALERLAPALLPADCRLRPIGAGLQAILNLPARLDDRQVSARAEALGVTARALSTFRAQGPGQPALVLGFAAVPEPEQERALRLLATVLG